MKLKYQHNRNSLTDVNVHNRKIQYLLKCTVHYSLHYLSLTIFKLLFLCLLYGDFSHVGCILIICIDSLWLFVIFKKLRMSCFTQ